MQRYRTKYNRYALSYFICEYCMPLSSNIEKSYRRRNNKRSRPKTTCHSDIEILEKTQNAHVYKCLLSDACIWVRYSMKEMNKDAVTTFSTRLPPLTATRSCKPRNICHVQLDHSRPLPCHILDVLYLYAIFDCRLCLFF